MEGFTALKEVYSMQLYLSIECGVSYSLTMKENCP
jgi:hypothetical protein